MLQVFVFKLFVPICLLGLALTPNASMANKKERAIFSLTTLSSQYQDIKATSNVPPEVLSKAYEAVLGLRIHSFYNFIFVYGKFIEEAQSHYGVGFKVDTPGYFWVGAKAKDYSRTSKRYPVNTSLFGTLLQTEIIDEASGAKSRSIGSNLGVAIDIFLFNPYSFFTAQASAYSLLGNAFINYSLGVGIQL